MKVESVFEEILAPSQIWTPDGGRNSLARRSAEKEKSSAAMAMPTSGNGADGLGVDGKTGRERRGG